MSVSKMAGKLTFAMLVALALGGCVVGSGDAEDSNGKTEQAASDPAQADKGIHAEDSTGSSDTSGSSAETSTDPLPWVKNDPSSTATSPTKLAKVPAAPPRTEPFPE